MNRINDDQGSTNFEDPEASNNSNDNEEDSSKMKFFESSNSTSHANPDEIRVESFMDTNKIFNELRKGGFNEEQSELILNLIRTNLSKKLNQLNAEYSRQYELDNESYLFKAAHGELLVEIKNSREIGLMNLTNRLIILKRRFQSMQDETLKNSI
ncbi:unnamed protein product [Ambrosiozyma monospora]|uniref:Unnamed protein product n=1 Tax=Ambrosiozyma monospora TaxID=43982 RepID=A0ACB5UD54_AMBMO|nr:unnamed protein product [Ambrosiozyma monospora]